jgi:hypothetical protein
MRWNWSWNISAMKHAEFFRQIINESRTMPSTESGNTARFSAPVGIEHL